MEIGGEQCNSLPQIEKHIIEYYKSLFGTETPMLASLDKDFRDEHYKITENDRLSLVAPFTELELYETIFESDPAGAPGPDGFSFLFYQHFWSVIKEDLLLVVPHFYNHSLRVAKLNHAMLCLIPKEPNASIIQKFRSISLVDCCYKII
jgi:hypothetical protein